MNNIKNNLKRIFLGLFVVFFVFFTKIRPENSEERLMGLEGYTLKGQIISNPDWKSVPQFRIFFQGQETVNNQNGFYSFTGLEKSIKKYNLIVCKKIKQNFEKDNTIENLTVVPKKSFLHFSFKKTGTTEKGEEVWTKKDKRIKKTLETKKFVIPENCIIVQINPKYIDKIELWDINLKGNFIKLPKIFLKNNIDEEKIKREANKSLLYSLDYVPFHALVKQNKKAPDLGHSSAQKIYLAQ